MKVRGCRDVEALLGAYLDGELSPHEATVVAAHLAACAACQAEYAALERGDRAVLTLDQAVLSPGELDALADRVRARVAPVKAMDRAATQRERPSTRRLFAWPRLVPVAAAAVVLLLVLRVNDTGFLDRRDERARSRVVEPAKMDMTADRGPGIGSATESYQKKQSMPLAETMPAPVAGAKPGIGEPVAGGEVSVADGEVSVAGGEAWVLGGKVSAGGEALVLGDEGAVAGARPGSEVSMAKGAPEAARDKATGSRTVRLPGTRAPAASPSPPASQGAAAGYYVLAAPEPRLAVARDLLARGEPVLAAAVLDSLLATLPPGDPSPSARAARVMRLRAAAAVAVAAPELDRTSARTLAALYARYSGEESDPELASSWAARAIELTAGPGGAGADAADCALLAARISEFVRRFPSDGRADSLAAAGARLPCAP